MAKNILLIMKKEKLLVKMNKIFIRKIIIFIHFKN